MMLYFLYELITLFVRQLKRTVTGIKKEDLFGLHFLVPGTGPQREVLIVSYWLILFALSLFETI